MEVEGETSHAQDCLFESNMCGLVVNLDCKFDEVKGGFGGNVGDGDNKGFDLSNGNNFVVVDLGSVPRTEAEEVEQPKASDLVWGKVKSRLWWPGQIVDPLHASEKAMISYKNDCHLVVYFGNRSFAWIERSSLKPFRENFAQMEKQGSSVVFRDAVDCALGEVSRRVQLGLSCSCLPKEIYAEMKSGVVTNPGVQENACKNDGVDRSLGVALFEPGKFVEYIKSLALYQCNSDGRLEFVTAQAQLAAFYGSKGYFQLPKFHVAQGLSEHDVHVKPIYDDKKAHSRRGGLRHQIKTSVERRDNSEDTLRYRKKEKRLSELVDPKTSSSYSVDGAKNVTDDKGADKSLLPCSGKKRKFIESPSNGSPSPRDPKVGQRFSSIARQLDGSPPVLKFGGDSAQKSAADVDFKSKTLHEVDVHTHIEDRTFRSLNTIPKDYFFPDKMLSQLCLAARIPSRSYSFLTSIVGFFTDFRKSISQGPSSSKKLKKSDKKVVSSRKPSKSKVSSTDSYEYEAVRDSYWTDRFIQYNPDEPLSVRKQKTKAESSREVPLIDTPTFGMKTSRDLDLGAVETVNSFQLNPTSSEQEFSPSGGSLCT